MQGVLCGQQYSKPMRVNAEVENIGNHENGENGDELQENNQKKENQQKNPVSNDDEIEKQFGIE